MPGLGGLVSNGAGIVAIAQQLSAAFLQYPLREDRSESVLSKIADMFIPSYDIAQKSPPVAGVGIRGKDEIVVFLSEAQFALSKPGLENYLGTADFFITSWYTGLFLPSVAAGNSIGHGSTGGPTGTLSCILTDPAGDAYFLSCNHVLADLNRATLKDPVWHPGARDGGTSSNKVGSLYDYEPILWGGISVNRMDAAIAKADPGVILSKAIPGGIGIVGGFDATPGYNIPVRKYGKITGLTRGDLLFHNLSMMLPYSTGVARYVDQYGIVETSGKRGAFALQGDSGSLVVNNSSEAIGIVTSIASTGDVVVASPIEPILNRFGLHF
jgi:hypothetical protein